MINGVTIGEKHSFNDWGTRLSTMSITLPLPKTNYVDIPGRDGPLDLTEVFGQVNYYNRDFTIELTKLDATRKWETLITEIANYVHGKKLKITFDKDPDHYYYARCTVDRLSTSAMLGIITIYCNSDPYKYKQNLTVVEEAIDTSGTIILTNDRMPSIPTITVDAEMTLTWGDYEVTLSAGEHKLLDLVLEEGDNTISVSGTGTITFTYQEGAL